MGKTYYFNIEEYIAPCIFCGKPGNNVGGVQLHIYDHESDFYEIWLECEWCNMRSDRYCACSLEELLDSTERLIKSWNERADR